MSQPSFSPAPQAFEIYKLHPAQGGGRLFPADKDGLDAQPLLLGPTHIQMFLSRA